MKGMVFTELLLMAEAAIGEEAVDEVIDSLNLESGGAYTSVGSYPCEELFSIIAALSTKTGVDAAELQRQFGLWVFQTFKKGYPHFFQDKENALQMLEAIENQVHVEVRKLYPDAELPNFATHYLEDGAMQMHYRSERPLVAFCRGMMEACIAHFDQPMQIEQMPGKTDCEAVFTIRSLP